MQNVRYIGDYYKYAFEKGNVYRLLDVEGLPDGGVAYHVYSPNLDDDGLFPAKDFELTDDPVTPTEWDDLA